MKNKCLFITDEDDDTLIQILEAGTFDCLEDSKDDTADLKQRKYLINKL